MLDDPAAGLAAFHQDQDELRRKVLENIQLGTTGLREENRELRRRQEKMPGDLSDTRAAVEALRREIAQAWAHTISASTAAAVPGVAAELARREQRVLEAVGTDGGGEAGREEAVDASTEPVDEGGGRQGAPREERHQDEVPPAPATAQEPSPSAPVPAPDEPAVEAAATSAGKEDRGGEKKDDYRRYVDSVLKAAAIASARLVCHRDTWTFVIEQTSQHPHFRHPDRVGELEDGQIETFLSGRSLLAVLVTMRKILDGLAADETEVATWVPASAVYRRTQLAVADAKHTRPDGAEVTTIVLDDRPVPAGAS
ncbi:hypothetical protein [Streptomyces rugosispiralis]|uniref:Uncharacterized protein n=1 Tax=Streptomyces rugosispiralis TaxID=2967341 RepID=A0ABT1V8J7_9ACTN|nr:hypothetical protein [Streptomyces rugosispiralis]MCQ8193718.1 hypothetical protein [Streptomyces rugosispiralis]